MRESLTLKLDIVKLLLGEICIKCFLFARAQLAEAQWQVVYLITKLKVQT